MIDTPRGPAPRRRSGPCPPRDLSRQTGQTPLLRFLSLQRSLAHVALIRKSRFQIVPASALSFCPCGFSRQLRALVATGYRVLRNRCRHGHSPNRFPVARRTRSVPRHPRGLVEPAKVRRRSWGSNALRSLKSTRRSRDLFGRAHPTCRFLNAAPVFLPGDQPVSHW